MIGQIATHYLWWILALILIGIEVALPGYFMLWIGIGAALTGVLLWLVPGLGLVGQVIAFAVLALLVCLLYGYALRPRLQSPARGGERLNHRAQQMIGQRYVLTEAIINGRGKAGVGDSQWLVSGPDLPQGATVEVTAIDGTTLQVRSAS